MQAKLGIKISLPKMVGDFFLTEVLNCRIEKKNMKYPTLPTEKRRGVEVSYKATIL